MKRINHIAKIFILVVIGVLCLHHSTEAEKLIKFSKTYRIEVAEYSLETLLVIGNYLYDEEVLDSFNNDSNGDVLCKVKIGTLLVPMSNDEITDLLCKKGLWKANLTEVVILESEYPELHEYSQIMVLGSFFDEVQSAYCYKFYPVLRFDEERYLMAMDPYVENPYLPAGTNIAVVKP